MEPARVTQHSQPHEFPVGHVFEGKYKILRELGRGGFGMVYLGYQESMDRQVALKVLKGGPASEHAGARERFLREVKIIAKLKHPNTVTIHESGETVEGALYMVLEFVEGEELKQILKRDGAQDPLRVCSVSRQIAKSLAEAHRHGVVHRDLKPANVMLTRIEGEEDFVKVLDFGVARLLDPKTADLTSVGLPEGERELIGTPRYMSPEQVRGESLTGASDIYSLGLIMYEMLIGEPAVQGDTTMALITQQISPEPLRLWGLEHHDPLIQDIVRIATSKSLNDRFQTAEQMGEALDQAIFNMRRARNLTNSGASSGDFGAALQTGFNQYQDPSGFQPGQSGWNRPPSGNWNQQQPFDPRASGPQQQPFDPRMTGQGYSSNSGQHGFDPRATGQNFDPRSTGQGFDPRSTGQGFDPRSTGQGFDPRMTGQNFDPRASQPGQPVDPMFGHNNRNLSQQSDANEIEVDMSDFQQTVERNALNRDSMPSFSELPPVEDANPFEEPKPVPQPRPDVALRPKPAPPEDDDLVAFSFDLTKILFLSVLAALAVYTSFIVLGAALVEILEDPFLRLVATGVFCAGIPLFTALGENSQKERFRVLEKPRDRIIRILIGSTVFSVAAAFLVSVALASTVVRELRTAPNWYFSGAEADSEVGLPGLNRRASYTTADAVEWTAAALGMHTPSTLPPDDKTPGRLPAPTRNKVKSSAGEPDTTTNKGEALDVDPGAAQRGIPEPDGTQASDDDGAAEEPKKKKPEPTHPIDEEDEDYVRW